MKATPLARSQPRGNLAKRPESEAKGFIKRLWSFMNKDLGYSFLDADVVDLSMSIAKFLNQDIVGQKIILLDDGKLNENVSSVAIFLKRQRYLRQSKERKQPLK